MKMSLKRLTRDDMVLLQRDIICQYSDNHLTLFLTQIAPTKAGWNALLSCSSARPAQVHSNWNSNQARSITRKTGVEN